MESSMKNIWYYARTTWSAWVRKKKKGKQCNDIMMALWIHYIWVIHTTATNIDGIYNHRTPFTTQLQPFIVNEIWIYRYTKLWFLFHRLCRIYKWYVSKFKLPVLCDAKILLVLLCLTINVKTVCIFNSHESRWLLPVLRYRWYNMEVPGTEPGTNTDGVRGFRDDVKSSWF